MQFKNLFASAFVAVALLSSCEEETTENQDPATTLTFKFDNFVGTQNLQLSEPDDTVAFKYTNGNNQPFNVTKFGYYITNMKLEGPNGELHLDPVVGSADANKVKGFYHVTEANASSQEVMLSGIPEGEYDKVTFNVGIPEDAVSEGALGGILDVAEGAWFWNWNSGYIGMAFEGVSSASGQSGSSRAPKYGVSIHVGGWKDMDNMVNNVQTVTLPFSKIAVDERLSPKVHVIVDILKFLNMPEVSFDTTFSVHSPAAGAPFGMHIPHMFSVEHVHAN